MLFQVDMEIVFQRNPFFQKQVSLLFPAGNQPSAMIDNPMAGIVTVILRPAQNLPDQTCVFTPADQLGNLAVGCDFSLRNFFNRR